MRSIDRRAATLFSKASRSRELTDLDRFRASTLGFVFQSFYLLPTLTALENVQIPMFESSLGSHAAASKKRPNCSSSSECRTARAICPKKLSVGERQRVAIARALANDPKLLLADEPTGNLDSASGKIVLDLFDRLHRERGLTLVVITHDPQVAARAERTIWIRDGQLQRFVSATGTATMQTWQVAGKNLWRRPARSTLTACRTGNCRGRGRGACRRVRIAGKLLSRFVHQARRRSGRAATRRRRATVEGNQARVRRSNANKFPAFEKSSAG